MMSITGNDKTEVSSFLNEGFKDYSFSEVACLNASLEISLKLRSD